MKYLDDHSQVFTRFDLVLEHEEQEKHIFSHDAMLQQVAEYVVHGDDEEILPIVQQALEHKRPEDVIREGLIPGMAEVSRLWAEGSYFLPQVVLSADAMLAGISLCERTMGHPMTKKGKVITHTAEGDIHDIGQLIVNALLCTAGYEVINLGSDVPVDLVVQSCQEHKPLFLGGTALMTTTMTAFPPYCGQTEKVESAYPLCLWRWSGQ